MGTCGATAMSSWCCLRPARELLRRNELRYKYLFAQHTTYFPDNAISLPTPSFIFRCPPPARPATAPVPVLHARPGWAPGSATPRDHSPGAWCQLTALSPQLEGGSCCPAPAPALPLQGESGSPLGFLHPVPKGAQLHHTFLLPPTPFPGIAHALDSKEPHPVTSLFRDSLVGDILIRAGGSTAKQAGAKCWLQAGPQAGCGVQGPS